MWLVIIIILDGFVHGNIWSKGFGGQSIFTSEVYKCSKWSTSCILFRSCCNILHPSIKYVIHWDCKAAFYKYIKLINIIQVRGDTSCTRRFFYLINYLYPLWQKSPHNERIIQSYYILLYIDGDVQDILR